MYNEHRESLRPQVWYSHNNCSFSLTSQAGVEGNCPKYMLHITHR